MSDYNEDHYEQTLIQLFTERLGYGLPEWHTITRKMIVVLRILYKF